MNFKLNPLQKKLTANQSRDKLTADKVRCVQFNLKRQRDQQKKQKDNQPFLLKKSMRKDNSSFSQQSSMSREYCLNNILPTNSSLLEQATKNNQ